MYLYSNSSGLYYAFSSIDSVILKTIFRTSGMEWKTFDSYGIRDKTQDLSMVAEEP